MSLKTRLDYSTRITTVISTSEAGLLTDPRMIPAEHPSRASSELTDRLRQLIRLAGSITFRDWMAAALYDPQFGYYCRQDGERWGRAGDYRTSPERTPLFAATLARYFFKLYQESQQPKNWTIVEVGAGGGHFAEVALRTLEEQFPQMYAATSYALDEVSATSIAVARQRLARFGARISFEQVGQSQLEEGIIFSNELFDAFPVHRVTLENGELRELFVRLDERGEFVWTSGPLSTSRLSDYFDLVSVHLVEEGQIAEVNLDLQHWLAGTVKHLARGYLVTVDYGDEASNLIAPERSQGTLRAYRRHQFQDVLKNPGESDLTTTVDWTYVQKLGEELGLETVLFERLDQFLLRAGLLEQLELSIEMAESEAERSSLRASAREMILPTGMAGSFQILVQRNEITRGRALNKRN